MLTKDNCKILICCHKNSKLPQNEIFLPIQVGAALTDTDLGYAKDNQVNNSDCDNISAKNKSYCELTAMYWAWKNLQKAAPSVKYVGLNHYRRYFSYDSKKNVHTYVKPESFLDSNIIPENLETLLTKYDWILPEKKVLSTSLSVSYCLDHYSEDYRLTKEAINNLFPEYNDAFLKGFENCYCFHPYNMFVTSVENFNNYCNWLFSILDYVEQRSIFESYNPVQKRVFGYLAERLFNVYILKNAKSVFYTPVIFIDNDQPEAVQKNDKKAVLKNNLRNLKRKIRG